jgi:hypothetical protein
MTSTQLILYQALMAVVVLAVLVVIQLRTQSAITSLAGVAKDTHTLVNSNMGVQLRLTATFARRLADITNSPEDIAAANQADDLYQEHVKKQDIVDKGASV